MLLNLKSDDFGDEEKNHHEVKDIEKINKDDFLLCPQNHRKVRGGILKWEKL